MKLGLIGGVSPYACSGIYNKLCSAYKLTHNKFPEIVIYSVPCKEEDEQFFLQQGGQDSSEKVERGTIFDSIEKACVFFKENDFDAVGLCCNTLSPQFSVIADRFRFKAVISPTSATLDLIGENASEWWVLGSRYTCTNKLYGRDVSYLSDSDQAIIDNILMQKVCRTEIVQNVKEKLRHIIAANNMKNIVLGCTDLTVDDFEDRRINFADSSMCFVSKCLEVL